MADSTLNRFVASGTTAERAAFTPTPPTPSSGPDPGYTWFDTDDGLLYAWDGSVWVSAAGTVGTVTTTGSPASGNLTKFSGATSVTSGDLSGDVTTSGTLAATIAADAVTNAKLANMAQATVKGRAVGAGTGDPTDLTPTQATAILDALVGDSGAGGTKGLAPAPAAGDAAAGKYLSAAGTWGVPPGTGGSGTVTNTGTLTSGKVVVGNGSADVTVASATGWAKVSSGTLSATTIPRTIGVGFDGVGSALTAGGIRYTRVEFAGTITKATILADQSGSAVVDVWKDTYANYPPTVADTITASAKPTLSAAIKNEDSTLTGWTTSVSVGDCFGFKLDSASTVQQVTVLLTVAES